MALKRWYYDTKNLNYYTELLRIVLKSWYCETEMLKPWYHVLKSMSYDSAAFVQQY